MACHIFKLTFNKCSNIYLMTTKTGTSFNLFFWFHILITILAWLGPFICDWRLMLISYSIVVLQFLIFKECFVNRKHAMDEDEDATLYSFVFEKFGWQPNKKKLKTFIRRYAYILLAGITIVWQLVLGHRVEWF